MPFKTIFRAFAFALTLPAMAHAADCRPVSVPDFTAKDFRSGKDLKLSDFRGKPIVMNLWFSSCPLCRDEAPSFRKLADENPDVAVISLTNPRHSKTTEALARFLDQYRWDFPTLLDEGDTVRDALLEKMGVDWYAYPTTYLFDKDGLLVGKMRGAVDWDKEGPAKVLRDLRGGALNCYFPADEHDACAPFSKTLESEEWRKLDDEREMSSRLCRSDDADKLLSCLNDYCDKSQADDEPCRSLKGRCCAASTNDRYGCREARWFSREKYPGRNE
jgi:thiol-disulfide isomerase/thioredoxin